MIFKILLNVLLMVLNIVAERFQMDGHVYVLRKNNFKEFAERSPLFIVHFFATWSEDHQHFSTIFSNIAIQLNLLKPPIYAAKVDISIEKDLTDLYNIDSINHLMFFKNGVGYDYDGPFKSEPVINYIKEVSKLEWKGPENRVITLAKNNFTNTIQSYKYILVEFFAPWCVHCQKFAPQYARLARLMSRKYPFIGVAAIDANEEMDIAKKYNVVGFPTIQLFKKTVSILYSGARDVKSLMEWTVNNSKDSATNITSHLKLTLEMKPNEIFVLGLFKFSEDLVLSTFIESMNLMMDTVKSGFSCEPEIWKMFKLKNTNVNRSIVIITPEYLHNKHIPRYIDKSFSDNANITVEDIVAFVENHFFTFVTEYNKKSMDIAIRKPVNITCYFFMSINWEVQLRKATQKLIQRIVDIAVDYRNIRFFVVDDDLYSNLIKLYKLEDTSEDVNVGCDYYLKKFQMPLMELFDSDHVRTFLDSLINDEIYPLLKSASKPRILETEEGYKIITGDTYYEQVEKNPEKPGLIILFEGNCENDCKNQQKLLSSFSYSNIMEKFIMDISMNEIPHNVKAKPGAYFIKPHSGKLFRDFVEIPKKVDDYEFLNFFHLQYPSIKLEL